MECIILAGGLGTRLRSVTKDILPKCMAPVNGNPFLHYLFEYLESQRIDRVVLSVGHRSDTILDWISDNKFSFDIDHVQEHEPLGTGGAIQFALQKSKEEHVLVLNGDTLFLCDLHELYRFHLERSAATSIGLKRMYDYERYGSVIVTENDVIQSFEEKKYKASGFINAGVYMIDKFAFSEKSLPSKFSFEKAYLETFVSRKTFYGKAFDNYFIDIGIPEDYEKAQTDFITLFP